MKRILHYAILATVLLGVPFLCCWLGGYDEILAGVKQFPPRTEDWGFHPEKLWNVRRPFNWWWFSGMFAFTFVCLFPLVRRGLDALRKTGERETEDVRRALPWFGWVGILIIAVAWVLAWTRFDWFRSYQPHTYFPLWLGLILILNAVAVRRSGRSPLTDHPFVYALTFPVSSLFWWFFEYLNRYVWNWYYLGVSDMSALEYCAYGTLCFSTVLPGVMAMAAVLGTFRFFDDTHYEGMSWRPDVRCPVSRLSLLVLAATGLTGIVYFPDCAYDLCSTDGGHRCCRIASVSNIVLKLAAAIPLARAFGVAGLAFSTALGLAASSVIMAFHLRSDANTLRFVGGFSFRTFLSGVRFSALDQLFLFGDALKMLTVNAFVISNLGERFLPVVPAFTAVSTLQLIQYATAVSAQPLVDVYLGEGNNRRVKTVARMGIAVTFLCGLLPAAVLLAFPGIVPSFIGLADPGLLPGACTAVRIAAVFLALSLVCGFMDSFYIYTERFALSAVFILMDSCIAPILLGVGLGWLFAANGLWLGLASAPAVVLAGVVAFVCARSGNPYFLPSERDALTFVFDLELEARGIVALSERVTDILKAHGRYSGEAVKAPLVVEEALMLVFERNAGRRVLAEVTLDLNDGVSLTLRDDGEIFDLTDADADVTSLRAYLVSNVMSGMRTKFNLVTMGENRSRFCFAEGQACAS